MAVKRTTKKTAPPKTKAVTKPPVTPEDVAARVVATGLIEQVYRLPRDSIRGPGDYAALARALRDLAGGAFPLEDITDTLDPRDEQASLEVSLGGVHHVLSAYVSGADVDEGVLVMLAALFERQQASQPPASRRALFVDATTCKKAKTYLFACATRATMAALNAAAGAAFVEATAL